MKTIAKRLGVTETQVEMAYYSGALPASGENLEFFIECWAARIQRATHKQKPKTHGDLIHSTN